MYWLRLIYSLRGERWLGPYLLPIFSPIRDTGAFFLLTSLCIAAATHAYIILGPRGEDPYPVYSAFMHTFRLAMLGDFDLFEYQGQDTVYEQNAERQWEPNDPSPKDLEPLTYIYLQGLFLCTSVGIQVLLMNLLVGILGQNYEKQQGRAQVLFVQARARMLLELQGRPWAQLAEFRKLFGSRNSKGNGLQPTLEKFDKLPLTYRQCASWAITALGPLRYVLAPPRDSPSGEHPKREDIFQRCCAQMVYKPVVSYPCLSLIFPVISIVLLALSLVSLLIFVAVALVLRLMRMQVLERQISMNRFAPISNIPRH